MQEQPWRGEARFEAVILLAAYESMLPGSDDNLTTSASRDFRVTALPPVPELLLVVAAFAIATFALTFPAGAHPTRTLPSDLVDTLLNTWILGWDAQRLPHALRGVWDAPIYFPYRDTLAFSENLFGVAFFVAPVYWFTGNPVLTYNVAFLLSFVVAGLGMYLLARSITGSRGAAAIAGAYYAFCPFRMAQISHIQMVATGWLPIAAWALHGYFGRPERTALREKPDPSTGSGSHRAASMGERPALHHRWRWLVLFAAAACLQATSNSYVAYYMAVPFALVILDGLWRSRADRLKRTAGVAIAGVAAIAVLLPVAAPYSRVRHEYRQVRSAGEIADGGADVRAYLVPKTTIGIGRFLPTAVVSDPEKELFPGFIVLLLSGVAIGGAIVSGRHRAAVALYGTIALAGFLFSLGPYVRVWGHVVTRHGPYEWLLYVVPAMNGMRVPARFAIIFVFGLSVVVACGAAAILRSTVRGVRTGGSAVLLLLVIADGWAVPLPVFAYPGRGRPEDRAVAEWLRPRSPGAVLHLPILTFNFQELNYQYSTLAHGHPLVNGFSGYNTPLQMWLRNPRSPLYDWPRFSAVVRMLRELGVRYVIVHRDDYNLTQVFAHEGERTMEGLRASGEVVAEQRFLGAYAFELAPVPSAPPRPAARAIPASAFTLTVSEADDRTSQLVDGDPDTRWIGHQEGGSWIEARLAAPANVSRIDMQLATRSIEEYPRELQIDVIEADGRSRTLYRDTPYAEFLRGFVANPDYPTISIDLPPNHAVRLAIHETAVYPDRWWSVHELKFWRAAD